LECKRITKMCTLYVKNPPQSVTFSLDLPRVIRTECNPRAKLNAVMKIYVSWFCCVITQTA